jgi:hypothetical protein
LSKFDIFRRISNKLIKLSMSNELSESALHLLFDNRFYVCEASTTSVKDEVIEDELPAKSEEISQETKIEIQHIGANKKGVFMVFAGGNMSLWPTDLKHVFMKILSSIGLKFNDIACTGFAELGTRDLDTISEQLKLDHLILWGIDPGEFGILCEHFQSHKEKNLTITSLPRLAEINDDVVLKRKLWECIKTLEFKPHQL